MYSATGKVQNRKRDHWPSEQSSYWYRKFKLHAVMGDLRAEAHPYKSSWQWRL